MARPLREDRPLLCASPGYLDGQSALRAVDDLAGHRLLDFRADTSAPGFDTVDATGRRHRVRGATVALRSNQPPLLVRVARHGLGIALMPDAFVVDELASGTLVRVLPGCRWLSLAVDALYVLGRRDSPTIRAFLGRRVEAVRSGTGRSD